MTEIVENFDFNKVFIIHPDDYSLIPGLSSAVMTLKLSANQHSETKSGSKSAENKIVDEQKKYLQRQNYPTN